LDVLERTLKNLVQEYLRNIHGRSACAGRRKTKQEEDERRKPQPRRITMDHLLNSPSLGTRYGRGYNGYYWLFIGGLS